MAEKDGGGRSSYPIVDLGGDIRNLRTAPNYPNIGFFDHQFKALLGSNFLRGFLYFLVNDLKEFGPSCFQFLSDIPLVDLQFVLLRLKLHQYFFLVPG